MTISGAVDAAADVHTGVVRGAKEDLILQDRTVIDEDLLIGAIKAYRVEEVDSIGNAPDFDEPVELREITTLILSFKNIYEINNLYSFGTLTKLQLDNNIISKIEHLEHLTNLQWLDLSFNNISKIEGLEALVNLTDLSLFNNQIAKIEGLDTLTRLNVLSLGNNMLSDVDEIRSLRQFRQLRCLNLKGNPFCSEDDYQLTVFGYLTTLKYFDYVMIDIQQFQKARDAKLDLLVELEEKERAEEESRAAEAVIEDERVLHEAANLGNVASSFDRICEADSEHAKLALLPSFGKILEEYRTLFDSIVRDFVEVVLARHATKERQLSLFRTVMAKVKQDNETDCIEKIREYQSRKKKTFALISSRRRARASAGSSSSLSSSSSSSSSSSDSSALLAVLKEEVMLLSDTLMEKEMRLVDHEQEIVNEFDQVYGGLVSANVNKVSTTFRSLTDVANVYDHNLHDLAHQILEKFHGDDAAFTKNIADNSHQLTVFLQDKEAVNNAVATSHENHIGAILAKEDETRDREQGAYSKLMKEIRGTCYNRNRARVIEISNFLQRELDAIEVVCDQEARADDDEMAASAARGGLALEET